jgi:hypothetical protein
VTLFTVHRRAVTLHVGDYPVCWDVVRFEPAPYECRTLASGNRLELSASVPTSVRAPIGTVRAGELIKPTPGHPGLDATSVLNLARRGERGFTIVPRPT